MQKQLTHAQVESGSVLGVALDSQQAQEPEIAETLTTGLVIKPEVENRKPESRIPASAEENFKENERFTQWQTRIARASAAIILGAGQNEFIRCVRAFRPDLDLLIIDSKISDDNFNHLVSLGVPAAAIILESDPVKLMERAEVLDCLAQPCEVIQNTGTNERGGFDLQHLLLLGRSKSGLLMHLRTRPLLLGALRFESLEKMDHRLVSIRTIQSLWQKEIPVESERERLHWLILEELIK